MNTRAEFLEAALKEAAAKLDHENHPVATKLFAAMARSRGIHDHSPDATKMIELQAANRELVEALDNLLAAQIDPMGIKAARACKNARAILAKHKGAK